MRLLGEQNKEAMKTINQNLEAITLIKKYQILKVISDTMQYCDSLGKNENVNKFKRMHQLRREVNELKAYLSKVERCSKNDCSYE